MAIKMCNINVARIMQNYIITRKSTMDIRPLKFAGSMGPSSSGTTYYVLLNARI